MSILKKLSVTTAGAAFVALGMLSMGEAKAVTIGADTFGYTATDEIPFIFEDVSETGTSVLARVDNNSISVNLGFGFNFYGTTYTRVSLSSNGLMSFGGTNNVAANVNFTAAAPSGNRASIAPLWDDWILSSNGVFYQTLGTPGNQRFIVQWDGARSTKPSSPDPITFQAILFQETNDILFSYVDVNTSNAKAYGGSATVGIRDVSGNVNGENLQWSYNSRVLSDGQSICFSTSGCARLVPFEFSPGLGILALGAWGVAARLNSLVQKRKFSGIEFFNN